MILQDSFNPSMPPSTLGAAGTEEAEACNRVDERAALRIGL
jgi:hypothetical protein